MRRLCDWTTSAHGDRTPVPGGVGAFCQRGAGDAVVRRRLAVLPRRCERRARPPSSTTRPGARSTCRTTGASKGRSTATRPPAAAAATCPRASAGTASTSSCPSEDAGRRVFVEFDGVMAHSDVWINGEHSAIGRSATRASATTLTPHVKFGDDAENVIAVRADNTRQPASRWYAGAGIYRHVRLVVTRPRSLAAHGSVRHHAGVDADEATVRHQPTTSSIMATADARDVAHCIELVARKAQIVVPLRRRSPETVASGSRTQHSSATLTIAQPAAHGARTRPAPLHGRRSVATATASSFDDAAIRIRHPRIPLRARHRLLAQRPEHEAQRRLPPPRRRRASARPCRRPSGGGGSSGSSRSASTPSARRTTRPRPSSSTCATSSASSSCTRCSTAGPSARTTPSGGYQHDFKEWWERDLRDAVLRDRNHPSIILYSAGNEIRDNLRRPEGFEQFTRDEGDLRRARRHAPGDDGRLPPQPERRVRQRLLGADGRRRPELPRGRARSRPPRQADAKDRRHRERPRPQRLAHDARQPVLRRAVPVDRHRLSGRDRTGRTRRGPTPRSTAPASCSPWATSGRAGGATSRWSHIVRGEVGLGRRQRARRRRAGRSLDAARRRHVRRSRSSKSTATARKSSSCSTASRWACSRCRRTRRPPSFAFRSTSATCEAIGRNRRRGSRPARGEVGRRAGAACGSPPTATRPPRIGTTSCT